MGSFSPKGRNFPERKIGNLDVSAIGKGFLYFLRRSISYELRKVLGKNATTEGRNATRNTSGFITSFPAFSFS